MMMQTAKMLSEKFSLKRLGLGEDEELTDVFIDSREARAGKLFAALPGVNRHGAEFAGDVIEKGVRTILTDAIGASMILADHPDICVLQAQNVRLALAQIAREFYPKMPERIVAVTGTNGKTSMASFVQQIWSALGFAAVNFGTAGVEGAISAPTQHTTPEPVALHKLLEEFAKADITHAAMEASSHGLEQHRLDGVRLSAAGFTNLTRDHLDYHPSFGDYFVAKAGLFDRVLPRAANAVINLDDPFGQVMRLVAEGRGQRVLTTGRSEMAKLRLLDQRFHETGQDIRVEYQGMTQTARLQLVGDFQAENLLVAIGLVLAEEGVRFPDVMEACAQIHTVRGRMQLAAKRENGAAVYVDYAHTPDALARALQALKPHVFGRLIVVFGAGGDRDPGKRPLMGKAAIENADIAIVTDDNPRSENPATIRQAVLEGAVGAYEIGDRAESILRAIDMAERGDIVLIAGKGHESGQIIGDQILPFDDVEQASISVAALEGREL